MFQLFRLRFHFDASIIRLSSYDVILTQIRSSPTFISTINFHCFIPVRSTTTNYRHYFSASNFQRILFCTSAVTLCYWLSQPVLLVIPAWAILSLSFPFNLVILSLSPFYANDPSCLTFSPSIHTDHLNTSIQFPTIDLLFHRLHRISAQFIFHHNLPSSETKFSSQSPTISPSYSILCINILFLSWFPNNYQWIISINYFNHHLFRIPWNLRSQFTSKI